MELNRSPDFDSASLRIVYGSVIWGAFIVTKVFCSSLLKENMEFFWTVAGYAWALYDWLITLGQEVWIGKVVFSHSEQGMF